MSYGPLSEEVVMSMSGSVLPPPLPPRKSQPEDSNTWRTSPVVPPQLPPRPKPVPLESDVKALQYDEEPSCAPGDFDSVMQSQADVEEKLSETQLRELYDDEEIERFLHIFSAYVREVKAPITLVAQSSAPPDAKTEADDEGFRGSISTQEDRPSPDISGPDAGISERIAKDYVVPLLPAPRAPPSEFNLHRLKLTAQRLYLAVEPTALPFTLGLMHLATWQDLNTSSMYCTAYWILWYHNLLLPALILRILYELVRHKIFPYPSLEEIRVHRQEVDRAKDFSVGVTMRLAAAPTFDVQDAWRLFKDYNQDRKAKNAARKAAQLEVISPVQDSASIKEAGDDAETCEARSAEWLPVDDVDIRRAGLFALNEIADLLERIKNIFLWRKPSASVFFGMALVVVFFFTLLPAKYLVKISSFSIGFIFWHVVPVLVAIPSSDRARIPPPLNNVPTDAEYAMELISQRVARGLDVKPKRRKYRPETSDSASLASNDDRKSLVGSGSPIPSSTGVDWKKWGTRAAAIKTKPSELRRNFGDGGWKRPDTWTALNPLTPKVAVPHGHSEPRVQTYTFPAQYAKTSGLVTLTESTFFFTSLLSSTAKLSIPLEDMLGAKKTGAMRGLNICWMQTHDDGRIEEREEKFLWVGARNDLFARLVAMNGHRWSKV